MTDTAPECLCLDPAGPFVFNVQHIGIDRSRYGEVDEHRCKLCGRRWLHYFVEYEQYSQSGRWYRGVIAEELTVTPENAAEILQGLPWHFYGGSYFATTGRRGTGPIYLNS